MPTNPSRSPRTGKSARKGAPGLPDRVRVLVIGAGFAGLGAAIKLDETGEHDFLVVDRGDSVGGTWRDNSYPGAACDVPSQLYSFSFAPNTEWSRSFSPQPEIHAYLQRVAEESGVLDRFRFGVTVEGPVRAEAARTASPCSWVRSAVSMAGAAVRGATSAPGSTTSRRRSSGTVPSAVVARTWTSSTSPTTTASVPGLAAAAASAVPGSGPWSAS